MGDSDDEDVAFRSKALDVVKLWLLGDNGESTQEIKPQRRPVTLYRSLPISSGKSLPRLTRPTAASPDAALTAQDQVMKRKILRTSCSGRIEEEVKAEQSAQEKVQYEEEQELVRLKSQSSKDTRKRHRTAHENLLDKLREEASKKKAKNSKRKRQLQRKKQHKQNKVATV